MGHVEGKVELSSGEITTMLTPRQAKPKVKLPLHLINAWDTLPGVSVPHNLKFTNRHQPEGSPEFSPQPQSPT